MSDAEAHLLRSRAPARPSAWDMVDEEARQTLAASNQGESMTDDSWYWCFAHNAAEHAGSSCPPEKRIGPYESQTAAEHWQDRVDDRNRAWDAADE